ncbi:hypothetical protein [Tautonia plasticadhaerens]|uniref:Uncharacterized protein n=1 Tax=Tautonia plasticadhaerens TaxID=2527974 RepID=A0A518GZP0_9BACT|nr:hypothetical protein [Tautonia plasticadhaerens]QDV34041.1 hypothetical protein ElP_19220 [Tautonia plasticadhaerens]
MAAAPAPARPQARARETTGDLLRSLVGVELADEAAWDLRRRPVDPRVHPLMGADCCWTPALEGQASAPIGRALVDHDLGVPRPVPACSICESRRDADGEVLPGTGVRPGDPFVCLGCQCASPGNAGAIRRGTRPRPRQPSRTPRGRTRLAAKERAALARKPEGPPCLALCDARDAGEAEAASAIERAFALHRSGLITLAELHDRAGTEPGVDPRDRGRPRRPPRQTA